MEEKRNIQISLKEAREWYNSGDSFKKELALKAYREEELALTDYHYINSLLSSNELCLSIKKSTIWEKLLRVSISLYKKYEPTIVNHNYVYYIIIPKLSINFNSAKYTNYKGLGIKATSIKPYDNIYFNSLEAAKQAIDILGDELKILFE